MNTKEICLGEHHAEKIFSGRNLGAEVREKLRLDEIDVRDCIVNIIVPKETWTINSSYFLGLFNKSISFLGEENFREKYKFVTDSKLILMDIESGIEDAQREFV